MVRRIFVLAILATIALGLANASQVFADVGPRQSDNNLRWARHRIEENLDMLQRDRYDYNGYRIRAIEKMRAARDQINQALRFDRQADWATSTQLSTRMGSSPDNGSDRNFVVVRAHLEHIIDFLQRDNRDYGGHRVAAIGLLRQARDMLAIALRSDGRH